MALKHGRRFFTFTLTYSLERAGSGRDVKLANRGENTAATNGPGRARVGGGVHLPQALPRSAHRVRERSNVIGVAANFEGFDFTSFWRDDAYARKAYISPAPSDALIASTEDELGYKLPAAYVALMKLHNGGVPHHRCFPAEGPTGWAEDHVALTGFSGSVATRTVRSLADWAASS